MIGESGEHSTSPPSSARAELTRCIEPQTRSTSAKLPMDRDAYRHQAGAANCRTSLAFIRVVPAITAKAPAMAVRTTCAVLAGDYGRS
jgi:hypothetical protein